MYEGNTHTRTLTTNNVEKDLYYLHLMNSEKHLNLKKKNSFFIIWNGGLFLNSPYKYSIKELSTKYWLFPGGSVVKNLPAM